ncbi:MAG: aldehyde dehydrogenase family protein, partial [Elusimicrobia bacterium]|nr:aldehyde dehydrogenase family protein [Elusimicrobiota bacterium]
MIKEKEKDRAQNRQQPKTENMLIDGKWTPGLRGGVLSVTNPATEEKLAETYDAGKDDVDLAVRAAKKAFDDGRWSKKSPAERAALLYRLADKIESQCARLARLETDNVGKPIKLSQDGDIPFSVDNLRFFAGASRVLEGKAALEYASGCTSFIRREPLGVVGLIAPWNYPFMMAVWKAAPALAAGNTLVLKPSELTPLTTLAFGRLAQEAGIPDGVINIVTGGETAGRAVTEHPDVAMISFTGDTATGAKILGQSAPGLKRCQLELGGKAPFVVFEDADLKAAVQGAVVGAFMNAGQICIAIKRVYAHESIHDRLVAKLAEMAKAAKVGDGLNPDNQMGPVNNEPQLQRVSELIEDARKRGGKIEAGGTRPAGKGYFFLPTIVTGLDDSARLVAEEQFGPALPILKYRDIDDAVERANSSHFGLGGSVWSANRERAEEVASRLQAGTVWVNNHLWLEPDVLYGGIKESG